jgi:hypothetical protein
MITIYSNLTPTFKIKTVTKLLFGVNQIKKPKIIVEK